MAGAECLGLGGQRHGGHRPPSPVGLTGRLLADCLLGKTRLGLGGRLLHPLALASSVSQVLFDKRLGSVPTHLQVSLTPG